MRVQTYIVSCPFEGLFIKNVVTFVGNDAFDVEQQMLNKQSVEFDSLRDFLMDSSAYNHVEMDAALLGKHGYMDLLCLAKKWGWDVKTIISGE